MNTIVIVTDSLRADHVGCYGNEWIRTPNLDALAKESTLIKFAYSEGLPTMPTRTAWWTGKFTFPFRAWQVMELSDLLLAEYLWSRGLTSALITDVYHMHKPGYNCGRGFDYVQFIRGQEYDPYIVDPSVDVEERFKAHFKRRPDNPEGNAHQEKNFRQYLKNVSVWKDKDEDSFVAQTVKAGIKWLENHRGGDDMFLWLDCFDPHEPWDPPRELVELYNPGYKGMEVIDPIPGDVEGYLTDEEVKHCQALYAAEVTLVDKWVGVFVDALRSMGYLENSLVVHTSDHGHPLGHHGIIRKAKPWLYEDLVRIPLIIRHPEGMGAGTEVVGIAETCDLMPTILDFMGLEEPDGMHGTSLMPLVRGEADRVRQYAYVGWHLRSWAIKNEKWGYLMWLPAKKFPSFWAQDFGKTHPELYDIENDPDEKNDVVASHPEVAKDLELNLRQFVDRLMVEELTR